MKNRAGWLGATVLLAGTTLVIGGSLRAEQPNGAPPAAPKVTMAEDWGKLNLPAPNVRRWKMGPDGLSAPVPERRPTEIIPIPTHWTARKILIPTDPSVSIELLQRAEGQAKAAAIAQRRR